MCVIFFYVNSNPLPGGFKLILASNRDEFYHRDTRNVSKWPNTEAVVYGGIDLEPGREGGTWLAIGAHKGVFKVGALLNLTGEPKPQNAEAHNNNIHYHCLHHDHQVYFHPQHHHHEPLATHVAAADHAEHACPALQHKLQPDHHYSLLGRGMLVSDFVTAVDESGSIDRYNKTLLATCDKYSAFNFISIEIGDRTRPAAIKVCSNAPRTLLDYEEGKCYGFGNSLPHQPFAKVLNGQQTFAQIVNDANEKPAWYSLDSCIEALQRLLKSDKKFWPDSELERRAPHWGEHMSSLNVTVPDAGYGSRTHTIILIDGDNVLHFVEETMATLDPAGEWARTEIVERFFTNDNATA